MQIDMSGLIKHVCIHGVGHPNYSSAREMNKYTYGSGERNPFLAHDCCGCCQSEQFPGALTLTGVGWPTPEGRVEEVEG